MEETPEQKALKLARLSRSTADNPLARRNNSKLDINKLDEREATLAATHDAYEGMFGKWQDPLPVIAKRPQEYYEQPGRISINLTKLFIDILSVSYDEAPTRVYFRGGERVSPDDPVLIALNEMDHAADFDMFMGMVDRWMRLFGNVVARPVWDEANQTMVFHAYPSYCVRVVENVRNPRAPLATVLLGWEDDYDDKNEPTKLPSAEIWRDMTFTRMVDGKQVGEVIDLTSAEYNYDFMPLVHCFDQPPFGGKGGYYVNAPGWQIAQQNQRLNEDYITQYIYAVLMQSIGVNVVKGTFEGELVIGPGRALHFPNPEMGQGFESVTQGAMLGDFMQAIEFILDMIRESYGIPKSVLQAEVSSSGQAIIQASAPLAEMRAKRQPLFQRIERDMLRAKLQEMRGRHDAVPFSLDPMQWDVSIMYSDPQAAVSTNDQIAMDNHLLSVGVLTPGDIAMRERPGQFDSIEEADAWIQSRKGTPVDEEPGTQPEEEEPADDEEEDDSALEETEEER